MTGFLYKAYISYAHADEAWAAWLQKALESYRVPSRLRSAAGGDKLPQRLAPIFRDREDLSSARDLSESLKQALRDSQAMILVCSPAAAASRWVNEEVRFFQSLGRADQVFCMIVDGEPGRASGPGACFPPALFDGVEDASREPLAADPRDFADGKRLAKLKLVAGLLGVRLDELRQRDLRRRRRWQALGATAGIAALVLALSAWQSSVAERQEREKAEQMAGFIVSLVEDLSSELDLESLSRMSARALEYWQDLDPEKLSPEMRINVGLALRQIGRVSEQQGRYDEALDYLLRSRELFRDLHEQRPELVEAFFELGQAEFWVAYFHHNRGDMQEAWEPLREYDRVSRELYASDPDNERWLLELSYAVTGSLALKLLSGEPLGPEVISEANEAVEVAERVLAQDPDDWSRSSNYSTTLAWASDARFQACELDEALDLRRRRLAMAQQGLEADPSNNGARQEVAYAHTGIARAALSMGLLKEGERHLRQALRILREQVAQDESNQRLGQELVQRQNMLADLLIQDQRLEQAGELLEEIEAEAVRYYPEGDANPAALRDSIQRLLVRAHWHRHRLGSDQARAALREARSLSEGLGPIDGLGAGDHARRVGIEYWLWRLSGDANDAVAEVPGLRRDRPARTIRSCEEAQADARLAVMSLEAASARDEVDWLRNRGFSNPRFEEFVFHHQLGSP